MTPTPAEFEIKRRPVWDPAPGTACIWQCIQEKPLAMHRLSDRVLGSLYVAISSGLIKPKNCDLNESDLAHRFQIRSQRCRINLGHGLLIPDGKAVVSIPTRNCPGLMVLRGSGNATANLPTVQYNKAIFQENYPNWEQWRDELLYLRRPDRTLDVMDFESYTPIKTESTPSDWPQDLTRDRTLASGRHYRRENLNPNTDLPRDPAGSRSEGRQVSSQSQLGPSSSLNPTASSGLKGRKRRTSSVGTDEFVVLTDSEDDIDTPSIPNKKQKNAAVERVPSDILDRPGLPMPSIAPVEVHKAAIRAAFRDKSVNRTELFWTLLPYITLAEAEEILIRRKGEAEIEHE